MKKIYLIDCPGVVMGNAQETDEEKVLKGEIFLDKKKLVKSNKSISRNLF